MRCAGSLNESPVKAINIDDKVMIENMQKSKILINQIGNNDF
jgi:hypothetical protein